MPRGGRLTKRAGGGIFNVERRFPPPGETARVFSARPAARPFQSSRVPRGRRSRRCREISRAGRPPVPFCHRGRVFCRAFFRAGAWRHARRAVHLLRRVRSGTCERARFADVHGALTGLMRAKSVAALGVRRMTAAGFALIAAARSIDSVSAGLFMFRAVGAPGAGITRCSNAAVSYPADGRFEKDKGAASGVVLSASGVGGALFYVLVARRNLVGGWRASYGLTAWIMPAAGAVVALVRAPGAATPGDGRARRPTFCRGSRVFTARPSSSSSSARCATPCTVSRGRA